MKQLNLFSDASKAWLLSMREEAIKIAQEQGEVSADDIRSRHEIPSDVSRNVLGSLFKSKEFIWKGVKKSVTPSRSGGMISVWGLSVEFLSSHPQGLGIRAIGSNITFLENQLAEFVKNYRGKEKHK